MIIRHGNLESRCRSSELPIKAVARNGFVYVGHEDDAESIAVLDVAKDDDYAEYVAAVINAVVAREVERKDREWGIYMAGDR